MSSYTDNVCSLLVAIQNIYLIYVQLVIFLKKFFGLSLGFFFEGGGGGGLGHLN